MGKVLPLPGPQVVLSQHVQAPLTSAFTMASWRWPKWPEAIILISSYQNRLLGCASGIEWPAARAERFVISPLAIPGRSLPVPCPGHGRTETGPGRNTAQHPDYDAERLDIQAPDATTMDISWSDRERFGCDAARPAYGLRVASDFAPDNAEARRSAAVPEPARVCWTRASS